MILNSGLDAACTSSSAAGTGSVNAEAWPYFCSFIQYAAFGTSSSAPAATDTSLGSQVGSRSINRGGFSNSVSVGADDTNDVIYYEATFTRVFSIGSNVNATEWGLAPATTGNLSVRELFRADPNDNGSSPITLTLENGDELQLVITLRVQANWEYESKTFTLTGVGSLTGDATFAYGATPSEANIRNALRMGWPGEIGTVFSNAFDVRVFLSDQSGKSKAAALSGSEALAAVGSHASYTPGDYFRDVSVTFGTSEGNGTIYALAKGYSSGVGYRFILTSPASFTKASTHKLTLTLRRSVARL